MEDEQKDQAQQEAPESSGLQTPQPDQRMPTEAERSEAEEVSSPERPEVQDPANRERSVSPPGIQPGPVPSPGVQVSPGSGPQRADTSEPGGVEVPSAEEQREVAEEKLAESREDDGQSDGEGNDTAPDAT